MPDDFYKRAAEGSEHKHGADNLMGFHTHPGLGIDTPSGPHDHGIDYWGAHVHRAADGRLQVHSGGIHSHAEEDGLNRTFSSHYHMVLGDVGFDGLSLGLKVTKSEGKQRFLLSRGARNPVSGDQDSLEVLATLSKSTGIQPSLGEDWFILYQKDSIPGAYRTSLEKSIGGNQDELQKLTQAFAVTFGQATLAKSIGRVGDQVLVKAEATYSKGMEVDHDEDECEDEECEMHMAKAKRSELADSDFAVVRTVDGKKKRQLPIDTVGRARNALARMNQVLPKLSEDEMDAVRRKIKRRYPEIEVTGLEKSDRGSLEVVQSFILTKSEFKDQASAKAWVDENGYDSSQVLDLAESWVFLQKSDVSATEERVISTGIVAKVASQELKQHFVKITKVDKTERTVEGIVYEPYVPDAEGDWMDPEEIKKACYGFMKKSRTHAIDAEHDENPRQDCYLVENFIVPENHPHYTQVGAWVAKSKIDNDEEWAKVESGEYNGYSFGGTGSRIIGMSPDDLRKASELPAETVVLAKSSTTPLKKKTNRLKDVKVEFLSLTKAGANGHDWRLRKNHQGSEVVLYKSRDLRLADGSQPLIVDGTLTKLWKSLRSLMGFKSPSQDAGASPDQERTEPVKPLPLPAVVAQLAKRCSGVEEALVKLAKSNPAIAKAIENDPSLQALLAGAKPEELKKFAGAADSLITQQPDNGVSLPNPEDYSGATQQFWQGVGAFLNGGMGTQVEARGSFGGGSTVQKSQNVVINGVEYAPIKKAEPAPAASAAPVPTPAPAASATTELAGESLSDAIQKALQPLVAQMTGIQQQTKAEIDTLRKSMAAAATQTPASGVIANLFGTPEEAPAAQPEGQGVVFEYLEGLTEDDAKLAKSIQSEAEAGVISALNPFGSVHDLNGIQLGQQEMVTDYRGMHGRGQRLLKA